MADQPRPLTGPYSYGIYVDEERFVHLWVAGARSPYRLVSPHRFWTEEGAHCAGFNECIARCMIGNQDG